MSATHLSEERSALESSAEGGVVLKCKMLSVVEIFISEALCVSSFREVGIQGMELGAETVVFDSYQVFNQSRKFAHNSDVLNGGEKIPADRPHTCLLPWATIFTRSCSLFPLTTVT